MPATKPEAIQAIRDTEQFIGSAQRLVMLRAMGGEERQHFFDLAVDYAERIKAMPSTYETDGQGDAAIVHLHYFKGACDWWITEKDSDPDGEGQIQAFGLASLGYGAELGYISIKELIEAGVELDLYWTPTPLAEIKAKLGTLA